MKKITGKQSSHFSTQPIISSGIKQVVGYSFIKKLKSLPFIENIFLFGSRAKGTNDERSDIDLAIDCPMANDEEWDHIMKIIEDADTLLKIDCIRYDRIERQKLLNAILKNHYVLFKRNF